MLAPPCLHMMDYFSYMGFFGLLDRIMAESFISSDTNLISLTSKWFSDINPLKIEKRALKDTFQI